jgi:hypothetical protein
MQYKICTRKYSAQDGLLNYLTNKFGGEFSTSLMNGDTENFTIYWNNETELYASARSVAIDLVRSFIDGWYARDGV